MALDLAGGFVGGLAAALFLLPVYGMFLAAAVVGSAKLASLMAQLALPGRIDSTGTPF